MTAISSSPDPNLQREIDRKRGRFVPWIIAAFYLTFMLSFIGFVFIAYAHPPADVTEQAYEKGLAYNDAIAKEEAQVRLGWTSHTTLIGKRVVYHIEDAKHQPVTGAEVKAWFVHPDQSSHDRTLDLTEQKPGDYSAAVDLPAKGLWTVHVTAARGDDQFQAVSQIDY